MLVHSVKLGLEAHPGHVVVKCDLRNAFNEVERATMLERVLQSPVRALAPLLHALYKHHAHIYVSRNGERLQVFVSASADPSCLHSVQFSEGLGHL